MSKTKHYSAQLLIIENVEKNKSPMNPLLHRSNMPTHRAVCPVEDSAGEVCSVAHHPGHILGQVSVKVGATGPKPEPRVGCILLWALHGVCLSSMVDISHSVVTRGYEAFKNENEKTKPALMFMIHFSNQSSTEWLENIWEWICFNDPLFTFDLTLWVILNSPIQLFPQCYHWRGVEFVKITVKQLDLNVYFTCLTFCLLSKYLRLSHICSSCSSQIVQNLSLFSFLSPVKIMSIYQWAHTEFSFIHFLLYSFLISLAIQDEK